QRTMMCGLWRREKRWYSGASLEAQRRARAVYVALLRTAFFLTGRDFQSYVSNYHSVRGMDFMHDVHDWMGGYPYESILAPEVDALMQPLGFARIRATGTPLTTGILDRAATSTSIAEAAESLGTPECRLQRARNAGPSASALGHDGGARLHCRFVTSNQVDCTAVFSLD